MKPRTSALSVSAAALLLAAPLLTGCTSDSHPGAAAVVGGERITLAQVQAQVQAVREAQRAEPNSDELIAASGGLTRETVNYLVYQEVVERAAADAGVEVTRREVQQERAAVEQNIGGPDALKQAALTQDKMPLTLEQIDGVLRNQLLIQRLAENLGAGPDQQGQELLAGLLADTAERAGVTVNPRYGAWDPELVSLTEADTPWLRAMEPTVAEPA